MGISDKRKRTVLAGKIQFHEEVHYSYMVDIEVATELGLPALLKEATKCADDTQAIIIKLQKLLDACPVSEDVP